MDALKLKYRAKDQLHPILQDLVTGYARFKGSKEWEGRQIMVSWYVFLRSCLSLIGILDRLITLNGMKASDEITDEQARQVCYSENFQTVVYHSVSATFRC
jgi:ESCRT-I complex subunit VPS28